MITTLRSKFIVALELTWWSDDYDYRAWDFLLSYVASLKFPYSRPFNYKFTINFWFASSWSMNDISFLYLLNHHRSFIRLSLLQLCAAIVKWLLLWTAWTQRSLVQVTLHPGNTLPTHVSSALTLPVSRMHLKHHFFLDAYPGITAPTIRIDSIMPST